MSLGMVLKEGILENKRGKEEELEFFLFFLLKEEWEELEVLVVENHKHCFDIT
jgi:hypothetical protein